MHTVRPGASRHVFNLDLFAIGSDRIPYRNTVHLNLIDIPSDRVQPDGPSIPYLARVNDLPAQTPPKLFVCEGFRRRQWDIVRRSFGAATSLRTPDSKSFSGITSIISETLKFCSLSSDSAGFPGAKKHFRANCKALAA